MIRTISKRSLLSLQTSARSLPLSSNNRRFSVTAAPMASAELKKISTDKAAARMFKDSHDFLCIVILISAAAAGPYSQAIVAGNILFVSGQIPVDKDGNLIQGSITDKTRACAANVKAIVEAAGSSMDKIAKCMVFLDDMANFAEMNAEYEKHFAHRPARSCVAVKTLPKNVPVEIECMALL